MRLDDDNNLNVEDQRGGGGFGGFGGGGLGGLGGGSPLGGMVFGLVPLLFSRLGCFGAAIVIGLFLMFSGGLGGIGGMLGGGGQPAVQQRAPAAGGSTLAQSCAVDPASRLSCNVLANANGVWARLLPGFTQPRLVFYAGSGRSGCGAAQSAMGPFYCPSDQGIYLDTEFYQELQTRFGAPGDFAQAYVIAHELGHHIQKLQGIADRVSSEQARVGRVAGNALQVKMELQADCYAGVWAANARTKAGQPVLEPGDAEEGLKAASAIGDDTLQRESQGRVVPESFTHGSSAQRMMWLKRGLETGDPAQCDTFGA